MIVFFSILDEYWCKDYLLSLLLAKYFVNVHHYFKQYVLFYKFL